MMIQERATESRRTIVVVGNGMVGHRFCQRLTELDTESRYRIVTFCEEPRAAYDRVGLSQYFAHRDPLRLMLADPEWYARSGIELHICDRVTAVDRHRRSVTSALGK
jgi:nitrite reductase (NADH) large subunit